MPSTSQFSADGRFLAASVVTLALVEDDLNLTPGYAFVWDLRSPTTPPKQVPTGSGPQAMALSPDGQSVFTGWPLTAYDVASGDVIWRKPERGAFAPRAER